VQAVEFPTAATWIPECPFVSTYAAQALSEIYELLAGFLAKLISAQLRALAAITREELQEIDEELLTYSEWIEESTAQFQRTSERFREAVLAETNWRNGVIGSGISPNCIPW